MCRLDQNTVTMALRKVFYSLSLSTTALTHAVFYTLILINSNIALASYQINFQSMLIFMLNERKSEKAAGAPQTP